MTVSMSVPAQVRLLAFAGFACLFATFVGCGRGENAVILPGEGYQLTEQEKAYKALEDQMRREAN